MLVMFSNILALISLSSSLLTSSFIAKRIGLGLQNLGFDDCYKCYFARYEFTVSSSPAKTALCFSKVEGIVILDLSESSPDVFFLISHTQSVKIFACLPLRIWLPVCFVIDTQY